MASVLGLKHEILRGELPMDSGRYIYIYIYIFCLTHPETKQQHSWTSPLYPWPINPKILSTLRGLWSEAGLHGWEEVRKGKTNGKDNFSGCSLNIWGRQQSFGYESIPIHTIFLGGWTSIYQLFWCSPGVQGFDTLPFDYLFLGNYLKW